MTLTSYRNSNPSKFPCRAVVLRRTRRKGQPVATLAAAAANVSSLQRSGAEREAELRACCMSPGHDIVARTLLKSMVLFA